MRNRKQTITLKGCNWMFIKIQSLIILFLITEESTRVSSFIKLPLYPTAARLNEQNNDKICFLWSKLAHFHQVETNAVRVTKYVPQVNAFDTKHFDFSTPFKCNDLKQLKK